LKYTILLQVHCNKYFCLVSPVELAIHSTSVVQILCSILYTYNIIIIITITLRPCAVYCILSLYQVGTTGTSLTAVIEYDEPPRVICPRDVHALCAGPVLSAVGRPEPRLTPAIPPNTRYS